jgi:hypothetical protein
MGYYILKQTPLVEKKHIKCMQNHQTNLVLVVFPKTYWTTEVRGVFAPEPRNLADAGLRFSVYSIGHVGTIVPKKTKYGWTTSLFQDTTFKLLQCLGPRPSKPLLRSKLGFGFSIEPIHLGKLVNSWLQSVGHHQAIHISVSKLAWKASRAGLRSRKDAYRW